MMFSVQLRHIDDRPAPGGWMSSGRDWPTFYVAAGHHPHALAVAEQMGRTIGGWTRLVIHVCDHDATATVESRTVYAPGWDEQRVRDGVHRVRWSFASAGGTVLDGQPLYAEDDAATATLFSPDGTVALGLRRSARGKWAIETSDGLILVSWYRKRFDTARDAASFVAQRWGIAFTEVESWDDDAA